MKILGFSHIVSEVKDLKKSFKFYDNLGYNVEYEINQNIPNKKQSILFGSPSKVKVLYLKNKIRPSIGIELIKHDIQTSAVNPSNIVYGFQGSSKKHKILTDFDGNKLVEMPNKLKGQHLFIPVKLISEIYDFYKIPLSLNEISTSSEIYNITGDIFDYNKGNILSLNMQTLLPDWHLILHLIEVENDLSRKYLNQIGFSCFSMITDNFNNINYEDKLIGPFDCIKEIGIVRKPFQISFISDPGSFFVEFYKE